MNARIRLLAAVASLVLVAACGSATTVRLTPYAVGATSGTLPSATPSVSPVASSSSSSPPTATPSSPSAPTMAALLDTTHGWAVVGGRLLVTSDGGMTWTDRTTAVGGAGMAGLLGVSFLDPGHGWIALDEPFTSAADASYGRVDVWRTADGGLTWERSELPKAAVNHFGEIMPGVQFDFLDAMHGFAVISGGAASGRGGSDLYWTADGGATWSADRPTGGASGLSGLVAFADAEKHPLEEHLIRRVAGLLHVPHPDFIDAKLRARGKSGG